VAALPGPITLFIATVTNERDGARSLPTDNERAPSRSSVCVRFPETSGTAAGRSYTKPSRWAAFKPAMRITTCPALPAHPTSRIGISRFLQCIAVADVPCLREEHHLFRDVGRVIGDTLDRLGDEHQFQRA